jgi:aspartate aminotransferase
MTDRTPLAHAPSRRLATRIEELHESATLAIDTTAKSMLASGVDVISFAAGEPDFETPEFVVAAALEAAKDPRNHHYTPAAGLAELRAAIAEVTARDSGWRVAPQQVVVTNGGKQAVYSAVMALVDPGDEVLIPAPYWVSYPEIVGLAGGVPVPVPTGLAQGFKVTPAQLEAAIGPRTKALIHVSPSNPTGAVYTEAETRALAEVAEAHGIFVIADEIYQHLTYVRGTAPSIASVASEALRERLVLVNGVAKTFAMTGWRVGWAVAPVDIAAGIVKLQGQLSSNVANVTQRAALAAVSAPLEATAYMREAFAKRRQVMISGLAEIEGIEVAWPDGAFYAFPSVAGVLERSYEGAPIGTSYRLAELLLTKAQVAVVPGEAFYAPGHLRLSYALGEEAIRRGVERIADFLTRL